MFGGQRKLLEKSKTDKMGGLEFSLALISLLVGTVLYKVYNYIQNTAVDNYSYIFFNVNSCRAYIDIRFSFICFDQRVFGGS